ncbi:hypothetical protein FOL47_009135 [Perkinsus chesapeaki]|uniref:Uncharacterized protein n=1 Tax=Perkinsus chesapeaki TaxID=330153 RepID=A0A7J6LA81_PERCH|nr:hypothetical protein FOL47_009135 [Perkinsus chesapeaki]
MSMLSHVRAQPNGTYGSDTTIVLFFEIFVDPTSPTKGTVDLSGIPEPEYGNSLDVRGIAFDYNGTGLVLNDNDTDLGRMLRQYNLPPAQWSVIQYDSSLDEIDVNWNGTIFKCTKQHLEDDNFQPRHSEETPADSHSGRRLGVRNGVERQMTIERPEGNRTYWIYYPTTTSLKFVLVNLHCTDCHCDEWKDYSRLMDYAEEYKFVLFTPCAVQNVVFLEAWNAGGCCHATSSVNDTEFIKAMIRDPEWSIPEWVPVYAVGYSNGGMMAETLMCRNVVSRAVSIAGIIFMARGTAAFDACDAVYNSTDDKRMLHIHGSEDGYVWWKGNWFLGHPSVRADMARWAKRMGCSKSFNRTKLFEGRFKYLDWHCPWSRNVSLVRVEGGAHNYYKRRNLDVAQYSVRFLTAPNP